MKTLVCLLGQVRYPDITWEPWKKMVLDHLNADLILCGNVEHDNQFRRRAMHIFTTDAICDLSMFDGLPGLTFGKDSKPAGKMILSFRNDLWNNLVKHNLHEKYDMYIISRSDMLWTGPHPTLDTEHIWCVNGEFHLGLCDRHMVVPRQYLRQVLTVAHIENPTKTFQILHEKYNEGLKYGYAHCLFNLESFLYCRFKERGLLEHLGLSPFPMYLTDPEGKPRVPEELSSDTDTLTWPFTIIHHHLSPRGMFTGRAQQ